MRVPDGRRRTGGFGRAGLFGLRTGVVAALVLGAHVPSAAPAAAALEPAAPVSPVTPAVDEPLADETPIDQADSGATPTAAASTEALAAVPDDAIALPLGSDFTVMSGATSTISFLVPAGLEPLMYRAELLGIRDGEIEVSSRGSTIGVFAADAVEIAVPLDAGLVQDGALTLEFSFAGVRGNWCIAESTAEMSVDSVAVRDSALLLGGSAEMPESVAQFFGLGARSATVLVAEGDEQQLADAALNLVAAASLALGQDSAVRLVVGDAEAENATTGGAAGEPAAGAAAPIPTHRVVSLVPGRGDVVTSIDRAESGAARLTLTGGPEELAAATKAFARSGIALASAAETVGLAAHSAPAAGATELSLAQLGIGRVSLEGYGKQEAYIGIAQGSFGRTLERIRVELVGTVSSTAETIATVQLLWNNTLVDSFVVDPAEPQISRSLELPAAALRSGNGLVVRLEAVTANNECIDARLLPQVRLDLDTTRSTVTGVVGAPAVLGFNDFPQAFAGNAQLAFGAQTTAEQLVAAGELVASLQRATPAPLSIETVTAQQLIEGSASGILVGATSEQTNLLRAPLRLAEARVVSDGGGELTVRVDQPFAALQAVRESGRSLLLLGSYPASGDEAAAVMSAAVGGLAGAGWWGLDGRVRVATPGAEPVLIDVNELVPQEEAKADFVPVAWIGIGAVLLLAAAGLLAAGVRARRKRAVRRQVEVELATQGAAEPRPEPVLGIEPGSVSEPGSKPRSEIERS